MYYEINVEEKVEIGTSRRFTYIHYFATAKRSLTKTELIRLLKHFVTSFPSPEFHITITKYNETGELFNIDDFLKLE